MKNLLKAMKDSLVKLEERERKIIEKYTHHKLKKYHEWNRAMPVLVLSTCLVLAAVYTYFWLPYRPLFYTILVLLLISTYKVFAIHHRIYQKELKKRKIIVQKKPAKKRKK
jgi:uncharacterized membrane protein YfcA